MSLKHVAKHLTEQGRGPDDHLVHMSGKEVAGLQALAMAHGGSLTINPKTGLPEAGFLDDILPVLAVGAGIAFAPELGLAEMFGGAAPAIGEAAFPSATSTGLATVAGEGTALGAATPALTSAAAPAGWAQTAGGMYALPGEAGTAAGLFSGMGQYALPVAGGVAALSLLNGKKAEPDNKTKPMIRPYSYQYNPQRPANMIGSTYQPGQDTSERTWFQPQWQAGTPYEAADGGIIALAGGGMAAGGGPVEQMSNQNSVGANTGFPQAYMHTNAFATPYQTPISQNVLTGDSDTAVDPYTGEQKMAAGGLSDLGSYSDGGRLLRGPGDGVSDSIPAQIGEHQPARLADGEFVVPARIVSELGNGSTEAGAKQLYKMLDRVQNARAKTTAKGKVAHNNNPAKLLPA